MRKYNVQQDIVDVVASNLMRVLLRAGLRVHCRRVVSHLSVVGTACFVFLGNTKLEGAVLNISGDQVFRKVSQGAGDGGDGGGSGG